MKNDGPNDCQLVLEMLLFLMEERVKDETTVQALGHRDVNSSSSSSFASYCAFGQSLNHSESWYIK